MAIYHLKVAIGSKADGKSSGEKCAYITRTEAYKNKADELAYTASGNMPKWPKTNPQNDPSHYWKAADIYERDNGRLYREVEFALPRELNLEEQKALCHAYAEKLGTLDKGEKLPFTFAIHADPLNHNPHCHLMISERINDGIPRNASTWFKRANTATPAKGGALKSQELKGNQWLVPTRELLAVMTNEALQKAAMARGDETFDPKTDRIDHRTLVAQGIDRVPTQHMGATCSRMMARNVPCERGQNIAKANDTVEKINFITTTLNRQYPQPKSTIAKMHISSMRGLSTKHFGATRKDGNPKTIQEVMRDVEAILKNAQRMAEDTYRIQLETMKIETNTARIAAGILHDNQVIDFERQMQAWAELARAARQEAQSQAVGASSKVENRPPTGAPPFPKFQSPRPLGFGLDTNLNGSGFVPSSAIVSKPTISKLRRLR
jgi:hypothetical protein